MLYQRNRKPLEEIELCQRVPLHVYYNEHVQPLKKGLSKLSANSVTSICPFHNETDPSFHYWYKTGTYKCFGRCGKSGDVITMYQTVQKQYHNRGLTRLTAFMELCKLYNCEDLIKKRLATPTNSKPLAETEPIKEINIGVETNSSISIPKKRKLSTETNIFDKYKQRYVHAQETQTGGITYSWYYKENKRILGLEDTEKCIQELNVIDMLMGLKDGEVIK